MLVARTTLVSHEPRNVNGRNGSFTVHKFKTEDGTVFETSSQQLADLVYGLLKQPITLHYEETQNGDWTNRKIKSAQAGHVDGGPTGAPTGAGAPTGNSGGAPTSSTSSSGGGSSKWTPEDTLRVTRLSALGHAIASVATGAAVLDPDKPKAPQLLAVADFFVAYAFNGRAQQSSSTSPPASTEQAAPQAATVNGGDGGAAPAAEQAPASAPTSQTDDIPF